LLACTSQIFDFDATEVDVHFSGQDYWPLCPTLSNVNGCEWGNAAVLVLLRLMKWIAVPSRVTTDTTLG